YTSPESTSKVDSHTNMRLGFAYEKGLNNEQDIVLNYVTNDTTNDITNNITNDNTNDAMNDTTSDVTSDATSDITSDATSNVLDDTMNMNIVNNNVNNAMNNVVNNAVNTAVSNAVNDANDYFLVSDDDQNDFNISNTWIQTSGFGFQVFRNDKDSDNPSITYRKSFHYLSSRKYKAKKINDQNLQRLHSNMKTNKHSHKLNPNQVADIILRYYQFNDKMIQELKFFTSCKFNAGVQSTQNVESFNGIIKKALNSANTLCDVKRIINKRHEDDSQYSRLIDLKDQYMTIGLSYILSQFFSSVDAVLVQFLMPPVQSWQRFQISQSFTYKGSLVSFPIKVPESETINDNFIEDVFDEPQATLQSLLCSIESKKIIETWRIHYIGGLSRKENLTAINIALESNKDSELVQLLKNFIATNQNEHKDDTEKTENNDSKQNQDTVTKLHGASRKKRIKAITEISKGRALTEITNIVQEANHSETSSKQQC
ncbi:2464_t:CDS:2, partial [Racocetra fulgida]